jgi:hypothetical protein
MRLFSSSSNKDSLTIMNRGMAEHAVALFFQKVGLGAVQQAKL